MMQLLILLLAILHGDSIRGKAGESKAPEDEAAIRQRIKDIWSEASDAGDCDMHDLAKSLLAEPTDEKGLEWDDIMDGIKWSTIRSDFKIFFDATDSRNAERQARLTTIQAALDKLPDMKFVERAEVASVIADNIPVGYCDSTKVIRDQFDALKAKTKSDLASLASSRLALNTEMVQEVFHEKLPASKIKTVRGRTSICFELKHDVIFELRRDPATSSSDPRLPLEREQLSLEAGLKKDTAAKEACVARQRDLEDFKQQLDTLKKMQLMDDTMQSVSNFKAKLEGVVTDMSSLGVQMKQACEAIEKATKEKTVLKAEITSTTKKIDELTAENKQLEAAIAQLASDSDKATAAVEVAERMKAKVSYFVHIFLETFKQAVRAPLVQGLDFKLPLEDVMKLAKEMESVDFEAVDASKEAFKRTSEALFDLNKYCTEDGVPALNPINSVKVTLMTATGPLDFKPSALCQNEKITNAEATMATLRKHIQDKRLRIAQAVQELVTAMDDQDGEWNPDDADDAKLDGRLQRFQKHGPASIYEDYLQHWRIGADMPGKGGDGSLKRGLFLELVMRLNGLLAELKDKHTTTTVLYKTTSDNLKASSADLAQLRVRMDTLIKEKVKRKEDKHNLETSIAALKTKSAEIESEIKGLDAAVDALDDEIEKVEALIVETHGEIKASLLELGVHESDYQSLLEELQLSRGPFSSRAIGVASA